MATSRVPRELRLELWERDEGICGICDEPADPLDWTADHILPQVLGGATVIHNLRVTHPRCNRDRPHPFRMTDEQIKDATDEWTANEFATDSPAFAARLAELPSEVGMTLLRHLASSLFQVFVILLTFWSIGALLGLVAVGFRMVAG